MATDKNKKISINFLLVGHTRFAPDRIFGLIKTRYKKANIDTFRDFVHCVVEASPSGFSLAVPTYNPVTKIKYVKWYQWDTFLQQYYTSLPNITRYHYFTFTYGMDVECKEFADSNVKLVKVLKIGAAIRSDALPNEIIQGLSLKRQWYLYKELRPLCVNSANADKFIKEPKKKLPVRRGSARGRSDTDNSSAGGCGHGSRGRGGSGRGRGG